MVEKEGPIGISTRPHGGPQELGRQPDKPRKTDGLTRRESIAWARSLATGLPGRMCCAVLVACLIFWNPASCGSRRRKPIATAARPTVCTRSRPRPHVAETGRNSSPLGSTRMAGCGPTSGPSLVEACRPELAPGLAPSRAWYLNRRPTNAHGSRGVRRYVTRNRLAMDHGYDAPFQVSPRLEQESPRRPGRDWDLGP